MLRTSMRSAQALRSRSLVATAAAPAAAARPWTTAHLVSKRFYADIKSSSPSSAKSPSSASPAAAAPTSTLTSSTTSSAAPAAAVPRKSGGFFRRLRNYVLTLSILGALAFGGGVWYARINDTFHDFFVEYVPYAEPVVLYFEEQDFQKRFPGKVNTNRVDKSQSREAAANIRIPAQSGASWRVADADSSRQSSAAPTKKEKPAQSVETAATPVAPAVVEDVSAKTLARAERRAERRAEKEKKKAEAEAAAAPKVAKSSSATKVVSVAAPAAADAKSAYRPPEVDEPSRWPPASPIDPLAVQGATEPVVQDVVKMLNDIITVINADKASDKYGATIYKAKLEVNKVAGKVQAIRNAVEQAAAARVKERTDALDKAGHELVAQVDTALVAKEAQWRQHLEAELGRARGSYEERLALATERERQLSEERLQNRLLEQAVQLTQQFNDELRQRVEQERAGRLGRLQELSAAVSGLEQLTAGWTDVVEASQAAQQLQVAVDAVQARLADEARSGQPFVRELVAIKGIAAADPVVDAAIASIPPAAYQRGIASPAALIDRFRRVAAEVRKAALLPEDAGVASHASSYVLSKLMFTRSSAGAGDSARAGSDVESILTRTQALLEEGNLDAAAREVNGLQGWAKTLSRDWLAEVRKVLEVQQAVDVITAESRLRSLQLEKN